ncbi:MAG: class I SAM-dependent methyltransferase [Candidatus Coatesbacteria bacterium]|nr:class I SAM-dependent methyltransferase [Candidatus Coatesbacteria bacterium]
MVDSLRSAFERDRQVWDSCASDYENQIVCGHPDVVAYESFEEDLLDRVLLYLIRDCGRSVHLHDIGCGSGRLHVRYGLKVTNENGLFSEAAERVRNARQALPGSQRSGILARGLSAIKGVDFSSSMIDIARRKIAAAGLDGLIDSRLVLRVGSAFELEPQPPNPTPVLVSLCNSIGVMQGQIGAENLFRAMRRAVESACGIAIISAYSKHAIGSFALGNYESTMEVCGQPNWLLPATYSDSRYMKVPRDYKQAHDPNQDILVDVVDLNGEIVEENFRLHRDEQLVKEVIRTGHIETYSDYESYWYSFEQFDEWIERLWPKEHSYHIRGARIDALRAEPAQLAILDASGSLQELLKRWRAL